MRNSQEFFWTEIRRLNAHIGNIADMHDDNVQSLKGVTLVGPGAPRRQDIAQSLALAPTLVAADGGAKDCLEAGHHPVAVIGDFDSLDPATEGTRQARA